ncbi:hypothetical protein PIROE2DRAFT_60900 [Piromyces sp. E2]|nr:hypothetical protein PIROE2DRAFT_60900 [Piromyces sp. E2]|eukprot:OUM64071.1 hypothetical protein PIROE2DRAFT_60900 [Piromyces sp. E2]
MKALFILILIIFIASAYCSIHNTMIELLAGLIFAAADDDGNIQRELGSLYNANKYLKVNVAADGSPALNLGITEIIPDLRNGNINFSELYKLAERVYTKHFPNGKKPIDIINEYDFIHYLTTSTKEGNIPISLFNGSTSKEIFYSVDTNQNKKIFNAIKSYKVNNNNKSININNNNVPVSIVSKEAAYTKRSNLIKAIAAQCINLNKVCKDKFFNDNHNTNNLKFNIITTSDGKVTKHSFIIDDNKSEIIAHPFTLAEKKDKSNKITYVNDETFSPREITYKEMVKMNSGYHKRYNNSGIQDLGIGLIPKCGIVIDNDGKIYQPKEYAIDNDHLNSNAKSAYIAKNKFNKKGYTGYGPEDNIVCRKSDNKFAELEMIVSRFVEAQKKANIIGSKHLEKINNLIKVLSLEKLFPVNMKNRAVGVSSGDGHIYELSNTLDLSSSVQNALNNGNKVCYVTTSKSTKK